MTQLHFGGQTIERVGEDCPNKSVKFLGHYLDDKLNWKYQILNIAKKVKNANYALSQCKNKLPLAARKNIYTSLLHSHLNFGSVIFGASKLANINYLESLQNKAVRNLIGAKYNSHTLDLYKSLNILKASDSIDYHRAILIMKFKNDQLPSSLMHLFKYSAEMGNNRMRENDGNLLVENLGNQGHGIFPINEACRAWNRLPPHLKLAQKTNLFKSNLKKFITESYINDCAKPNCYSCKQTALSHPKYPTHLSHSPHD